MNEGQKFFGAQAGVNPGKGEQSALNRGMGAQAWFNRGNGEQGSFYSLPQLEKAGIGPVSKLPVSIRLVLESVLRNCDGKRVTEQNVRALANWKPNAPR